MRGVLFDNVPHDWERLVQDYEDLASKREVFRPLAELYAWLAASPFRAAGLCAVGSMYDLIVGPSRDVLANPYLVISFDFNRKEFVLRYESGSRKPWSRFAAPSEIRQVLERFFIKRARWYVRAVHASAS